MHMTHDRAALEEKKLLTIREAGALLGLGRSLIYDLIATGEINSLKIGRARRIPTAALDEFIARRLAREPESTA